MSRGLDALALDPIEYLGPPDPRPATDLVDRQLATITCALNLAEPNAGSASRLGERDQLRLIDLDSPHTLMFAQRTSRIPEKKEHIFGVSGSRSS